MFRKQCVFNPTGNISIVCIDCGLKNNQLQILCQLGAKVTVFPWNHPVKQDGFDGLFLSSVPGDPQTQCRETITIIKSGITSETIKPPCLLEGTQYCFIASQNHAFAVLTSHVDKDWSVLFTNQNDLSNEGLIHNSKPFFSVQFYPEHFAGLRDAKNLFQIFLDIVQSYKLAKPINAEKYLVEQLSKRVNGANAPPPPPAFCSRLKKVLILGSNGLKFGQPGEFDCSANQAVKAMNEDNISTVLLNPRNRRNSAEPIGSDRFRRTLILLSLNQVYPYAITPQHVELILRMHKPTGILLSFGEEISLNCGIKLHE
ncbi:unnamed protein product [Rotaria magnacalcarata]|uniref:Uncharacterized protein n=3 Tax=Rotaria magnacalcarata TaxID=392030 RepID=A0A816GGK7_9BILA|nr:unnamed protein product [Rotaria magnacalcarata]